MKVTKGQVDEVVESVWMTMLGIPLTTASTASSIAGGSVLAACVHITGAWTGVVTLACSAPLARRAASAMFESSAEDVSPEEVHDALGELANMVGGNLKGLIPGMAQLSLPTVADGELCVPGSTLLQEAWFDCDGEALVVRVLARDALAETQERTTESRRYS